MVGGRGVKQAKQTNKPTNHGPTARCLYDSQTMQKYCKHFSFFYFGTKDTNGGWWNWWLRPSLRPVTHCAVTAWSLSTEYCIVWLRGTFGIGQRLANACKSFIKNKQKKKPKRETKTGGDGSNTNNLTGLKLDMTSFSNDLIQMYSNLFDKNLIRPLILLSIYTANIANIETHICT